jgi:hypothetical protein
VVKVTPEKLYTLIVGVADAVLVSKYPALFVAKNIVIPFIDMFGVYKLPDWLVYESYGALGIIVGLWLLGKLGWE